MSDPWARPAGGSDVDVEDRDGPAPPRPDAGPTPGTGPEPDLARAFGRPVGVETSFTPPGEDHPAPARAPSGPGPGADPSPALASAFGRPTGPPGAGLQRPAPPPAPDAAEDVFWDDPARDLEAGRDPWRDPSAAARLGAPALGDPATDADTRGTGPRLSVRDVLLGGRIAPRALAVLAVLALLVGGVGGITAYLVAGGADRLTDAGATLAQVDPATERPAGSVSDVARRVVPAVVSLEIRSGTTGGTGSGVVVDDRGDIVTNNHVVALAATDPRATLEVVFASGLRAPARVVGRDPQTDLAVVKVDVADPVVAQLGRSSALAVGDGVIAVGSPLGLAGTVTQGIVSSVQRPVRLDAESDDANPVIDAIQTDAAINPGNSGGALVDSAGAVIGINTAIRTLGAGGGGEGGSIGLGFAIPIDDVRTIAESLIRTGGYAHTDLGVNAKSVTDGTSDGAQVLNVRQGGVGARAGVAEGDVVVRVDQRTIGSADELVVAVREHRPGDAVALTVVRQGRPLVLQAIL